MSLHKSSIEMNRYANFMLYELFKFPSIESLYSTMEPLKWKHAFDNSSCVRNDIIPWLISLQNMCEYTVYVEVVLISQIRFPK